MKLMYLSINLFSSLVTYSNARLFGSRKIHRLDN